MFSEALNKKYYNNYRGINKDFAENNFLSSIFQDNKINLLHVTSSFNKIKNSGYIYPSTGCMVGGIYCTPLFNDNYRLHNLGVRYLKEAHNFCNYNSVDIKEIRPLLIEITFDNCNVDRLMNVISGFNYLEAGNSYYKVYYQMLEQITYDLKIRIQQKVKRLIFNSNNFLSESLENKKNRKVDLSLGYYNKIINNVKNIPILGYIIFESLSIAMMLNQVDDISSRYSKYGELYNDHYKNLVFSLYPDFYKHFNLAHFKPKFRILNHYIKDLGIIKNFDNFFYDFLLNLNIFIQNSLFNDNKSIKVDSIYNVPKNLSSYSSALIGHLLRLITIDHKDFMFYRNTFYSTSAKFFWKTLKQNNKFITFNSIVNKGEFALTPTYDDFNTKIEIYEGEIIKKSDLNFFCKKNLLNLKINQNLLNSKYIKMSAYKQ